jgi:hypothetical protein
MTKEAADGMSVQVSEGPVPIGYDHQSVLKFIASGVVRQKSKHIDVKYHHVHDEQQRGLVRFQYVASAANPADLLTKPLAAPRHEQLLWWGTLGYGAKTPPPLSESTTNNTK